MRNLQEKIQRLSGIYELDSTGKILDCIHEHSGTGGLSENFVGKNLDEVVERLLDETSFRRKLKAFLNGHNTVESHNLNCFQQDEIFQLRVMMARRSANLSLIDGQKSVLVYIQRG